MKSILFSSLLFLTTSCVFSQNEFESAYYIDIQGIKTEGFLKVINFDSVNSASFSSLTFKKELNSEETKIPIQSITTFGIGTSMKYEKCRVEMDDVNLYKNFDSEKNLMLTPTALFLNVMVEGKATLYSYASDNGVKYFYKLNGLNNKVTQLIYKKYLFQGKKIKENTSFREQLFKEVLCPGQTYNDFLNINYDKNDLESVFENFNKCQNSSYVVYNEKFKKNYKFNFTGLGGMKLLNNNLDDNFSKDSQSDLTYNVGLEAELVLPSNKYSLFVKMEYSSFNTELLETYYTAGGSNLNEINYEVDSKSVDFTIGARYYYQLNKLNKLFMNAGIGLTFPSGEVVSTLTITNGAGEFVYDSVTSQLVANSQYFNFGLGYVFKNKIGVALNFDLNKSIISDYVDAYNSSLEFKQNSLGLNFRYTFN